MIVRTGRRIPGVVGPLAGVHYPISIVRMAVGDAYGAKEAREGYAGADDEVALRTERITRGTCRAVAEYSFQMAERMDARVYGGPKWTVSPVYEGMLKEEMDAAASRHPDVPYQPVLVDALYAGLISGAADAPLVIPALNRDGDCLSDLVMPMFGSIAGAESVLLSFDDDYQTKVAMAEAPHGTAPSLFGKDIANPMAMILACGALLGYAAGRVDGAERASRAIYEGTLETVAGGVKTVDLGGHADHDGVHGRRRREDPDQDRRLVHAGHVASRSPSCSCRFAVSRPTGRPALRRAGSDEVLEAPPAVQAPLDHERQRPRGEDRGDVDRQLLHRSAPGVAVAVGRRDADVGRRRDRRHRDEDADQRAGLRGRQREHPGDAGAGGDEEGEEVGAGDDVGQRVVLLAEGRPASARSP